MTNVIRFPTWRPAAPQSPTSPVEVLVAELAAVELKLAHARLGQIHSETRQLNAVWFSWCLKRVVFWGLVLWLLTTLAGAAKAGEFRTFYGANGNYVGSSSRPANSKFTNYYDRNGQYAGTELRRGRRR